MSWTEKNKFSSSDSKWVKSNDRLKYVISDLIIEYVIKYLESRLFYSTTNLMELGPKKYNVPPKYGKSNNCLN